MGFEGHLRMSHASQETVDSDADNAAMPDDRKRGAGAPFAKVDLTRSHGIGASLHAPCLPPDIVEDPNVKAMEPQEPQKSHKKRRRKRSKASGKAPLAPLETSTSATVRVPMYASSCHVWNTIGCGKPGDTGNCAMITQHIFRTANSCVADPQLSRFKKCRREIKARKINALPMPLGCTDTPLALLAKPPKHKLYIGGISEEELPILPQPSTRWSVHDKFNVYANERGRGCHVPHAFTLLPREWAKRVFSDTEKTYKLFLQVLSKHKGLNPRGNGKVPVYDSPELASSYVTFGEATKRFSRGTQQVQRKLATDIKLAEHKEALKTYFGRVTHAAKAFLDSESIVFAEQVRRMAQYPGFSLDIGEKDVIWPSIAIAVNVAMELHWDEDYFIGAAGCSTFAFPQLGLRLVCAMVIFCYSILKYSIVSRPVPPKQKV
jgi:hypothetical protein